MSAFFYGRSKTDLIDQRFNMVANVVKVFNKERKELESYNRFPITCADQHNSSTHLFQILSKFLHSFRPVDLTAGPAGDLPLQPRHLNFQRSKHGR